MKFLLTLTRLGDQHHERIDRITEIEEFRFGAVLTNPGFANSIIERLFHSMRRAIAAQTPVATDMVPR